MAKYNPLDTTDKDYRKTVFDLLQKKPPIQQVNKMAGNAKFVPVSAVEDLLNWLFPLCWSHEITNFQVVINEIIITSVLTIEVPGCFHIRRAGAASCAIQQSAGASVLDSSTKIKNGLEKMFPKGKAECLKNAAKSLGPIFGSNLNRKLEYADERGTLQKHDYQSTILVDDSKLLKLAQNAGSKDELTRIWGQLSESTRASDQVMCDFAMWGEKFKQIGNG